VIAINSLSKEKNIKMGVSNGLAVAQGYGICSLNSF